MVAEVLWWVAVVVGTGGGLYTLHRLMLWLEREEWLCYLNRKPSGGGGGSALLELQKFVEPQVEQVQHVQQERKKEQGDGLPNQPQA